MVLSVHFRLGDSENIVEQEVAKVGQVMTLPFFDATFEISYSLIILRATLCFIDLVRYPLRCGGTSLELLVVWVINDGGCLD